jgi:hypothetical protein
MPMETNGQVTITKYDFCETFSSGGIVMYPCENMVELASDIESCFTNTMIELPTGLDILIVNGSWEGAVYNLKNKIVPFRIINRLQFIIDGYETLKETRVFIAIIPGVQLVAHITVQITLDGEPIVTVDNLSFVCKN